MISCSVVAVFADRFAQVAILWDALARRIVILTKPNVEASRGNLSQMGNYQQMMAGGSLAMYPEYWQLNKDLDAQPASAIVSFANRYPQTAMAEKIGGGLCGNQSADGWNYDAVRQVASYATNLMPVKLIAIALGFQSWWR